MTFGAYYVHVPGRSFVDKNTRTRSIPENIKRRVPLVKDHFPSHPLAFPRSAKNATLGVRVKRQRANECNEIESPPTRNALAQSVLCGMECTGAGSYETNI